MSSAPDWPPGTRVVCIKDDWVVMEIAPGSGPAGAPRRGDICTVSSVFMMGIAVITLREYPQDEAYSARCFERLPERESKTDISIFERIPGVVKRGAPVKETV